MKYVGAAHGNKLALGAVVGDGGVLGGGVQRTLEKALHKMYEGMDHITLPYIADKDMVAAALKQVQGK